MTQTRRQTLWLIAAAVISLGALAVVHALESFGHYLPCELCLKQREVYWAALSVAAVALIAGRFLKSAPPLGVLALGLVFLLGAGLAGYHAGVEWKWWPGPEACTGRASGPVRASDIAAILNGAAKVKMVRCDEAALRIAGLSLSGWNALFSLALSVASFSFLVRRRP